MSDELDQKHTSDEFDQMIAKNATKAVTYAAFGVLVDAWKAMNLKNMMRNTRLDALEQRLAALEAKPSIKYCGTWAANGDYTVGDATTHKGSLWICKANHVQSEPGVDFVCWQLAVKKGRDARDVRR